MVILGRHRENIAFLLVLLAIQLLLTSCGWIRVQITEDNQASSTTSTILSVTSVKPDGAYTAGDTLEIDITFSKVVIVSSSGTPTLDLNSNATAKAIYLSGSGTSTLTFRYTVTAGHNSSDLEYPLTNSLELAGATIQDTNGNSANLTLPAIGGGNSLGSLKNFYIDTTAPLAPSSLTDGTWFYSLSQSPTLTFTSGSDAESGIDHYEVKVQDHSNGDIDLTSFATLISGLYVTGLNLVNGNTYRFVLRAVDKAGNYSAEVISDGWTVDSTAPLAPSSIDDGVVAFSTTTTPTLSWPAGSDVQSGIQSYQIAIGDTSGGNNILDWTDVGNTLSTIISSLSLQGSKRYFTSIKSINTANGASVSQLGDGWWNLALNKVAVDSTTPTARMLSQSAYYGNATAISEDGLTMVLGAQYDNLDENGGNFVAQAGAAFVYVKSGGVWTLQQKLVGTGLNGRVANDRFGSSVAISGNTIVVGAVNQDYDSSGLNIATESGAAYVFTRSGSVWSFQQKLVGTGINGRMVSDFFGSSVAISGDTIAIGASFQSYDESGANSMSNAGAAYVFTRNAGVWNIQQKLVGTGINGRAIADYFGTSIAIAGDTIVVGASNQDYDENGANYSSNTGAAYVFTRSAGVWSSQQKLAGTGVNGRLSGDFFGKSVAINLDTIVVGASNQDYDENGANAVTDAGAACVFTRSVGVWSSQQKLVGTGANGRAITDFFGSSVAISGDTIIVGAYAQSYDENGANLVSFAGAAYVFTRSGVVWSTQQKLVGTGVNGRVSGDYFGSSVAISGDTIVVGAYAQNYDGSGANYVFKAGAAYIYSRALTAWTQDQKLVDTIVPQSRADLNFTILGASAAVSEDGLTMVVGAPYDNTDENGSNYISRSGAAYVYIKSSGAWVLQQKLVAIGVNSRIANDFFGYSVAISGETIVVGAYLQDYDASGANMVTNTGAAYIYTRSGGVWSPQQKLIATGVSSRTGSEYFGYSVAISGNTIVIGSYSDNYDENGANPLFVAGSAHVYTRSGSVWSPQQKLVGTGTNGRMFGDWFGASVAISGDTIVVGSFFHDYDSSGANILTSAGAVFVFTRSGTVWSFQQKLVGMGTNGRVTSDLFGKSVAINGDTIVVGAAGQDYDSSGANILTDAGAAFVFTRSGTVWSLQQKLVGIGVNGRMAGDSFGGSVTVSENSASDGYTIVIGAPKQSYTSTGITPVSNAGAAFVFY